jgi:hypothetical protein
MERNGQAIYIPVFCWVHWACNYGAKGLYLWCISVVEMNTKRRCVNFAIFSCMSKLCYDCQHGQGHVYINAEFDIHKILHQAAEKLLAV